MHNNLFINFFYYSFPLSRLTFFKPRLFNQSIKETNGRFQLILLSNKDPGCLNFLLLASLNPCADSFVFEPSKRCILVSFPWHSRVLFLWANINPHAHVFFSDLFWLCYVWTRFVGIASEEIKINWDLRQRIMEREWKINKGKERK